MTLFWHQLRGEQLMFWRSREAAVFVFIFPPLLFLLLGVGLRRRDDRRDPGRRPTSLAGLIGYGVANTAFAGLAITLVIRREYGILKRIRSTPLPASLYLAAVLLSTLLVFVLQSLVVIALGLGLFDARAAGELARARRGARCSAPPRSPGSGSAIAALSARPRARRRSST